MGRVSGIGFVLFYVILFRRFVGVVFFVCGFLTGGKYGILGRLRRLAQVLTYEGVMFVGLLGVMSYWARR